MPTVVRVVFSLVSLWLSASFVQAQTWTSEFGQTTLNDNVTIPAGHHIEIDACVIEVGSVLVMGTLTTEPNLSVDCPLVTLITKTIMVMGDQAQLQVGSEQNPYTGKLVITLTGDINGSAPGMAEQRQLMVMGGGNLTLYGASFNKQPWTSLASTVRTGANQITLVSNPGWTVGDNVVIASSNIDPREAEVVTIVGASSNGRVLTLSAPLQFDHFGKVQTFAGKTIDTRAEVGLLSHNIVIQGDSTSQDTGIGGNIMVMNFSVTRPESHPFELLRPEHNGIISTVDIAGVELIDLGQRGRPGRYAMHWHLIDDGSGSQFRNSSVHHGLQRAVVTHGTDSVTVEGIVGYHVNNHMFVPAEEGDEAYNRYRNNLAVLALPVIDNEFAFPGSNPNRSDQSEHRIAAFWLRTSFNELTGNRAAGVWRGQGFFYDHDGPNGRSRLYAQAASGTSEICNFQDNLAHSLYTGLHSPDWYSPLVRGFGVFSNSQRKRYGTDENGNDLYTHCTLSGFQAYKTQNGGLWLEDNTSISDVIVTDSHTGIIAGDGVEDMVVVGQTANSLDSGMLNDIDPIAHPIRYRGGFAQSNNGGRVVGRQFSNLTCISLPTCFFAQTNSDDQIPQFENASIDNVKLIDTPIGFATVDGIQEFLHLPTIDFGMFTDITGDLTGQAGTTGSLGDSVFIGSHTPIGSRWGWLWDVDYVALPDGDEDLMLRDGFEF